MLKGVSWKNFFKRFHTQINNDNNKNNDSDKLIANTESLQNALMDAVYINYST